MINRKKQKAWGALAAALLLTVCGCGKDAGMETADPQENPQEDFVYVPEYISLNQYCENIGTVILGENEEVFFTGIKEEKEVFFSLKIGEDTVKEFPLETENGVHITSVGKDAEGNLL